MKPGVFGRDRKRVGKKFTDLNFIVKKTQNPAHYTHVCVSLISNKNIETVICVANFVKD